MAANVTVPNAIADGQPNAADPVMANFNAILAWLNTNVVHLDGSKPMTGDLSGTGADPVSANQYARKGYVDAADARLPRVGCAVAVAGLSVGSGASVVVSWTTEVYDTNSFYPGSGTSLTIPVGQGGIYILTSRMLNASNISIVQEIRVNGVPVGSHFSAQGVTAGRYSTLTLCGFFNAGDVITVAVQDQMGFAHSSTYGDLTLVKNSV